MFPHQPTRIRVIIEIGGVILNRLNSENIVRPLAHLNTFKEPIIDRRPRCHSSRGGGIDSTEKRDKITVNHRYFTATQGDRERERERAREGVGKPTSRSEVLPASHFPQGGYISS